MAIESTPNTIFNPAAAVTTVSKNTSNSDIDAPRQTITETKSTKSKDGGAVKVEISHQVSGVSRAKAAAGDSNLSAETLAAISQGRPAPQIIAPREIPQESVEAAQQTADIQRTEQAIPADVEALSRASQAFEAANNLAGESSVPANIEALIASPAPAPVQATQDTATAALGNTADITV